MTPSRLLRIGVVVAVLAAVTTWGIFARLTAVRTAGTEAQLAGLSVAIRSFEFDTGRLPSSIGELASQTGAVPGWSGPYIEPIGAVTDNWKQDFVYLPTAPAGGRNYTLFSLGPDHRSGTSDDVLPPAEVTAVR